MNRDEIVEQTEDLLGGFLELNSESIESWEGVVEQLQSGRRLLIVLPWGGQAHQIVAERLSGDRILFFNPLGSAEVEGQTLGGSDGTPERRSESEGMESIALSALSELWKKEQLSVRALPQAT